MENVENGSQNYSEDMYYNKLLFTKDGKDYVIDTVGEALDVRALNVMQKQGYAFKEVLESKYVCENCGSCNETAIEKGDKIYINNHCKVCKSSF